VPVDPLQIALGAVIVASGSALTVTLVEPFALQPFEVTPTPSDTGPEVEVNVIAFVPAPPVIVPFVIVQAYEPPTTEATEAEPEAPLQIAAGAVIVAFGSALTATVAFALPLQVLLFVTVTPSETGPDADVNVIVFVPLPLVIVPLVIVHAYDAPLTAAVEALPVVPAQIAAGAVMTGAGSAFTATDAFADAPQLVESVTVMPSDTGTEVEVNVIAFVPAPPVIVPFVIVQA